MSKIRLKESAVVLLHEQNTDSLILTKRNDALREHPGEYCFPGGRRDESDPDLWFTALRELHEELGIQAERVRLIQKLSPEKTIHGKIIYPWLAAIDAIEPFVMNESEVVRVLGLPMSQVIQYQNYQAISFQRQGRTITSCQYIGCTEFVWGATAKIMKQLCSKGY